MWLRAEISQLLTHCSGLIHLHHLYLRTSQKKLSVTAVVVLTAVVRNHRQDVIVGPLVVEGFRVADDSVHVDDEGLVRSQDLVFADVPELRGAVPVGGLDPDDLPVDATLVHLADVARLGECGCILVDVRYRYVYGGAATARTGVMLINWSKSGIRFQLK